MDLTLATPLLGGMSPQNFMRKHWQRRPLLVRGAMPPDCAPLGRTELFKLAARDDVESRLVVRNGRQWSVRHGPFVRRALPPLGQPGWSLLVQGVDLHVDAAHRLLAAFRFVPDARLDDLMISYASDAGGVGPHFDSYDVFLLQVHGRRRWRVGPLRDATLRADVPLKMLRRLEVEQEWLLEPGDMLYLPPRWGHDGPAVGECMTCSIGFRAPGRSELARDVLQRLLDGADAPERDPLYADPAQPATLQPAAVPAALRAHAADGIARLLREPDALPRALGELLSEPKPRVVFDAGRPLAERDGLLLDRRTRMMYDERQVFINGESFRAGGRDARLMQRLADARRLSAADLQRVSTPARALLQEWAQAGWLHAERAEEGEEHERNE
jgi:50S ribosomal protein L16 3-hydroxylase